MRAQWFYAYVIKAEYYQTDSFRKHLFNEYVKGLHNTAALARWPASDLSFSAFSSAGFSTLMLRLVWQYNREARGGNG